MKPQIIVGALTGAVTAIGLASGVHGLWRAAETYGRHGSTALALWQASSGLWALVATAAGLSTAAVWARALRDLTQLRAEVDADFKELREEIDRELASQLAREALREESPHPPLH